MFDAVFLFEDSPKPTVSFPPGIEIDGMDEIAFLAIPEVVKSNTVNSTIFVFNTENQYFFSWAFRYKRTPCAIVIATSSFFASLFFEFLHTVAESFASGDESDPTCRFGFIKSLLGSWSSATNSEITINYPLESFNLDLSNVESWIKNFNVAPLFPRIEEVWQAMIKGEQVVIYAATPEIASAAAISAISMIEPITYMDPFLLFTQGNDPRASDPKYRLIATTDTSVKPAPHAHVIRITTTEFTDMSDLQSTYCRKTMRYYTILLNLMNHSLTTNPYFDMLSTPVVFNKVRIPADIQEEIVTGIQSTETFKRWRRKKITRDHIRGAFLSVSPKEAIKVIPADSYAMIIEEIEHLKNFYDHDQHFKVVLESHLGLIRKKQKKCK